MTYTYTYIYIYIYIIITRAREPPLPSGGRDARAHRASNYCMVTASKRTNQCVHKLAYTCIHLHTLA